MAHSPTPQQQAIIDQIADHPNESVMIDAVAGASKTWTMVAAAQRIRVSPCLSVAFNKRNADDLADKMPSNFVCKTLNSVGHSAWGAGIDAYKLDLDPDKMFKIVKSLISEIENPHEDLFTEALALARAAKSAGLVPRGAPMGRTGIIEDTFQNWDEIAFDKGFSATEQSVALARRAVLQSIKQAYQKVIDFDDQIFMSVLFGGRFPAYHTVIVDEAQDLSPLQHMMVLACAKSRLIAVGDPNQAIYAFRGADHESMPKLRQAMEAKFGEVVTLQLSYSFRTSKAVAERQTSHVPHFRAFETNKPGSIEVWPRREGVAVEDLRNLSWSLDDIPSVGAVLCRNNAPLMVLGFALIKQKRRVKILGRDIGASLATLLAKITNKNDIPIAGVPHLIEAWKFKELDKAGDAESKRAVIFDRAECLQVLAEASGAQTSKAAEQFIRDLFSDKAEGLVLSSGHRAKGSEWHWVMHLDPWRVPSKWAVSPEAKRQELNLRYVIETRTADKLVLANLDECTEIGA